MKVLQGAPEHNAQRYGSILADEQNLMDTCAPNIKCSNTRKVETLSEFAVYTV